ncbi:hypothetical protein [Acinetobacter indicus]|uniref:hypothetical protein n=1 Tax=Acinetobacter indicus TaxID=756892 RepID=UPI000CECB0C1|nr:hypothetical protein [Acinetobacter indicus]QIZ61759.1 hypothetical protein FK538_06980 [Acinetobacter indicus]
MVKKIPEFLEGRSPDRQNRILENAKIILKDYLMDEVYLFQPAEKAKSEETIKAKSEETIRITLDDLRARVHKNYA